MKLTKELLDKLGLKPWTTEAIEALFKDADEQARQTAEEDPMSKWGL